MKKGHIVAANKYLLYCKTKLGRHIGKTYQSFCFYYCNREEVHTALCDNKVSSPVANEVLKNRPSHWPQGERITAKA